MLRLAFLDSIPSRFLERYFLMIYSEAANRRQLPLAAAAAVAIISPLNRSGVYVVREE